MTNSTQIEDIARHTFAKHFGEISHQVTPRFWESIRESFVAGYMRGYADRLTEDIHDEQQ